MARCFVQQPCPPTAGPAVSAVVHFEAQAERVVQIVVLLRVCVFRFTTSTDVSFIIISFSASIVCSCSVSVLARFFHVRVRLMLIVFRVCQAW